MIKPRVLGNRALIKPLEANEVTSSGIALPDIVRQRECRGIVEEVGDSYMGDNDPPVSRGDVVVYAEHGTRHFGQPCIVRLDRNEDGKAEDLVVVEYADLLLVLEEPE